MQKEKIPQGSPLGRAPAAAGERERVPLCGTQKRSKRIFCFFSKLRFAELKTKLQSRCFPRFRTRRLKTSVMTEAGRRNGTGRQGFSLPAGGGPPAGPARPALKGRKSFALRNSFPSKNPLTLRGGTVPLFTILLTAQDPLPYLREIALTLRCRVLNDAVVKGNVNANAADLIIGQPAQRQNGAA